MDKRLLVSLALVAGFATLAFAAAPQWWTDRNVLKPGSTASDYAVINQGQLKNFARAARDEMLANGNISAGHPIDLMVEGWRQNTINAKDYAPVNLGQVKSVAKPFYDRLIELGQLPANSYPWSAGSQPANDYALANVGQVKRVFSFNITGDSDLDGLADAWELTHFGNLLQVATGDFDGDGLTNGQELGNGGDPANYYSQGGAIIVPALELVSGADQTSAPDQFCPQPLIVRVKNVATGGVLGNAPVSALVLAGGGGLATTNSGTPAPTTTLSTTANTSGLVTLHYKQPNASGIDSQIQITAGTGAPLLSHEYTSWMSITPAAIAAVVTSGSSSTSTLNLTNHGSTPVDYSIEVTQGLTNGAIPFGNTWTDSDMPGGPAYVWNDISTTGTRAVEVSSSYDDDQLIPLGITFPFFGANFTDAYVNANGYLTFGQGSYDYYPGANLPNAGDPANMIAALFADLSPAADSGSVYYQTTAGKCTIQFDNVTIGSSGSVTFQIVLEQSGRVTFYYKSLAGSFANSCTGLQNAARNRGVTIVRNGTYLKNEFAVRLDDGWLKASPLSGQIAAGATVNIQAQLRADLMDHRTLNGGMQISFVQRPNETLNVPVQMLVNDLPVVALQAPAGAVAGADITLAAEATDDSGPVAKVEFYRSSTKIGEDLAAPFSLVWASVPAGYYYLTAKAYDIHGAVTTTTTRYLNVQTDSDGDGLGDSWEQQYFSNLTQTAGGDFDQDQLSNLQEFIAGTQPKNFLSGHPTVLSLSGSFNAVVGGTLSFASAPLSGVNGISKVEFFRLSSSSGTGTEIGEDATPPFEAGATAPAAGYYYYAALASDANGPRGISASMEVQVYIDSDGDGLGDNWEYNHFGDLDEIASGDPDGDNVSNLIEFTRKTSPVDYYNGVAATITIVSGNGQQAYQGDLLPIQARVRIQDAATGAPLSNAPVEIVGMGIEARKWGVLSDSFDGYYVVFRSDANGYVDLQLRTRNEGEFEMEVTLESQLYPRPQVTFTGTVLKAAGDVIPTTLSAVRNPSNVALSWSPVAITSSTINVYRLAGTGSWTKLTTTPLAGIVTSWQDPSPPAGKIAYHLGVEETAGWGEDESNLVWLDTSDADADGIPDSNETTLGLNKNDWADGVADMDGDGVPNAWEFARNLAGINNAASKPTPDFTVDSLNGTDIGTGTVKKTLQAALTAAQNYTGTPKYLTILVKKGVNGVYEETASYSTSADRHIALIADTSLTDSMRPIELRNAGTSSWSETISVYSVGFVVSGFRLTTKSNASASFLYFDSPTLWGRSALVNCILDVSGMKAAAVNHSDGRLAILQNTSIGVPAYSYPAAVEFYGSGYVTSGETLISRNIFGAALSANPNYFHAYSSGYVRTQTNICTKQSLRSNLLVDPLIHPQSWATRNTLTYPLAPGEPVVRKDIHAQTRAGTTYTLGASHFTDADVDGLPDWIERSDPSPTGDADSDGAQNLVELEVSGTDLWDSDTDDDGMPDGWEIQYGLNPRNPADIWADADGDLISNLTEYQHNGNPTLKDTNGDGFDDDLILNLGFLNLASNDVDGDGISNALEAGGLTNPFLADTDGDGVNDSQDALPLDPNVWQLSTTSPVPAIILLTPTNAVELP